MANASSDPQGSRECVPAGAGLCAKRGRGESRLRDAHAAVADLPACFARVAAGELPTDWFDWLLRSGALDESPQERADALEQQRWGEHTMEYWSRPDIGGPDDPGPPGLDPRDGYGPPPF